MKTAVCLPEKKILPVVETFDAFITKGALAKGKGIRLIKAKWANEEHTAIWDVNRRFSGYYGKPHWHITKAGCDERVRAMIATEHKSIERAAKRLDALKIMFNTNKFTVQDLRNPVNDPE